MTSLTSNQLTRTSTLSWTIEYGADRNAERDGHPNTTEEAAISTKEVRSSDATSDPSKELPL